MEEIKYSDEALYMFFADLLDSEKEKETLFLILKQLSEEDIINHIIEYNE